MSKSKKHRIAKDKEFEGMYRVKYPDGELSADFYNLARAKNHANVLTENVARSARRMPGIGPTSHPTLSLIPKDEV